MAEGYWAEQLTSRRVLDVAIDWPMNSPQRARRGLRRIRQYSQVFAASVGFDGNDIRQRDSSEHPYVKRSETERNARTINDEKQQQEHSARETQTRACEAEK